MPHQIVEADWNNAAHAKAIAALLDEYARHPMGRGAGLPEAVLRDLVPGLARQPTAFALLAYAGDRPVGLAICFVGFSTFAARPLVNIHDLAVTESVRSQGVGRALLAAVEAKARDLGCCKVTLEVRDDNRPAQALYASLGFHGGDGGADSGPGMLFWAKRL